MIARNTGGCYVFALDQLQYFEAAESLPSDLAYDLVEGLAPQVIHSVLLLSVQEGIISSFC